MQVKCALLIFLFNICIIKYVACAKILFFSTMPALSHQKVYQEIWKNLSSRGHRVYAVTPNPRFDKTLSNLTEYDISSLYDFGNTIFTVEDKEQQFHKLNFIGMIIRQLVHQYVGGIAHEYIFNHSEVKRLVKEHDRFDVCILEWFYPSLAVFGHIFKCPTIGISSYGLPVQMLDTIGNPSHPILAPEQELPFSRNEISFLQTAWSLFWVIFVRIQHNFFIVKQEDRRIKKFYGKDIPYLGDLEKNVSLIILNRNPVFHRPIPVVPNIIELGLINYPKQIVNIDPDLKLFLDTSKRKMVYFSFGVSMFGTSMPSHCLEKFQAVFKNLPLNIIWKWENDTMPNKPSNVFISKYVPQVYTLEHPNVKLFITQGGLQSTEEAIAAHKPIIGIPLHSDQMTNVDTCVKYGMGKMLELEELTEEKLRSYILEIINDPSYAENAKKLDELMKDQPQDGLEKAIWWIEYVIRHKGAKHLRSIAVDLPIWKYLMLDIIGFILVIFLLITFVVYQIIKLIIKLLLKLICRRQNVKTKSKKKAE